MAHKSPPITPSVVDAFEGVVSEGEVVEEEKPGGVCEVLWAIESKATGRSVLEEVMLCIPAMSPTEAAKRTTWMREEVMASN